MKKKILSIIKNETKSEFGRNILTVFTGLSFSQIIPILVSPILTRLYTPEEFGILALFMSTGMIFGNIATFQYDAAIMLPKEESDAINLLALSLILTVLISLLSLVVVVLFNNQLTLLMANEKVSNWLYFVPISVILTGFFRSFSVWSSRNKLFRLIAARNITQTAATAGSKLGFGYGGYTSGGLIIGSLTGQLIATFYLVLQSMKITIINFKSVSLHRMKINASKYRDFPLFTNWQGFIDIFNDTGSQYIISNFYGPTVLGWYSFTFGILQRPLQLIGASVSQVFYQKGAEIYNDKKDLWGLTKKIIIRLSFIGLVIFTPLLIFGEQIFAIVFGNQWAPAGSFAQILVPWLLAKFIISPISTIPIILNKQKINFLISTIINISIPLNFYLLSHFVNSFKEILLFNSILYFMSVILILNWYRQIIFKGKL
ncbi:MAG: oligosaccharide flippase family protein [Melioribacteraceae bacterium]|nr:oligosaccharide flippase family protein [Melioribacteraceae bacterium]